jgi:dTDP-4-dehydrorhamnose 3,5-epimerase
VIAGVLAKALRVIPDERGRLMEILRCDEAHFSKFGQVYITASYPGVVKAWHYHKKQTDAVCCCAGMCLCVLYDARTESPTKGEVNEFAIGVHNPRLVTIPPGVYHGWKCISTEECIVVNVASEPYDYQHPDEFRLPPDAPEIPYVWRMAPGLKHG